MANIDNECSHLEVVTKFSELNGKDALVEIFNHQKKMQEQTYGYNFENMTIRDVVNYLFWNNHALVDEMHEMMDALGGIKDGVEVTQPQPGDKAITMQGKGNAAWKPWKSATKIYDHVKISDLSEDDLKELQFEYIDMLHFFMNIGPLLLMTPEKMFEMYMSKAAENVRRQKEGY